VVSIVVSQRCPPLTFTVERSTGSATEFHGRDMPTVVSRSVWIHDVSTPALVLGSSQRDEIVDDATIGSIEVVRRRSGGGAVLLIPDEVLWLDVLVPAGDPLWNDDVSRASHWLGDAWVAALGYGEVHRGPMVRTSWSSLVCFAGLGPGEVTVDGRKLVGISQRRTRAGARFQCAVYSHHDPFTLPALLRLSPPEQADCCTALASVATVPSTDDLLTNFLAALPS
jgi:lipoate---protein ligase